MPKNYWDDNIIPSFDAESPTATELRRIFNNMKKHCTSGNNTFLITSSNRGEGKSTIAAHLALTIAQFSRKKVLVIDADIRRPRMHKIYGLDNSVGLSDCLRDSLDPLRVVRNTDQENLYVITAGRVSGSPASMFGNEEISSMFKKVKFYYDYIIVDSAPVLAVSDTLFLSAEAQKVIFVLLAGTTPREVAIRAKNILVESNADILGVVLNNALEVLPYYYDYKYYKYEKSMDA